MEVFVHMIIKFETYIDMCSKNMYGLNTFKTPQNDKKIESKQHLEALALVNASYKVDSHNIIE